MSKYILTKNSIQYDGHTLYQIKRSNWSDEYGGYIEDVGILSQNDDCWVEEGAYVYGESVLTGEVRIKKGTVVKDSAINGYFVVKENCRIVNSELSTASNKHMVFIQPKTNIVDKKLLMVGKYDNKLFTDGSFTVLHKNTIELVLTDNYCRVNCQTFTYEEAWKIINDEKRLQTFINKFYKENMRLFTTENIEWLRTVCAIQLSKKRHRQKKER